MGICSKYILKVSYNEQTCIISVRSLCLCTSLSYASLSLRCVHLKRDKYFIFHSSSYLFLKDKNKTKIDGAASFDSENPPMSDTSTLQPVTKNYGIKNSYHLLFLFPPICVLFSDQATRLANFLSLNSTHPSVKVLFFFSVEIFSEMY